MTPVTRYILIVDDNEAIHSDIESIFSDSQKSSNFGLEEMEQDLFGDVPTEELVSPKPVNFQFDHAYQGQEAVEMVHKAEKSGHPYSLIYMDVRMPPGMDGIETINCIKQQFKLPNVIICSAYSDYTVEQIKNHLGGVDKLNIMPKPFDIGAIKQTMLEVVQEQGAL